MWPQLAFRVGITLAPPAIVLMVVSVVWDSDAVAVTAFSLGALAMMCLFVALMAIVWGVAWDGL